MHMSRPSAKLETLTAKLSFSRLDLLRNKSFLLSYIFAMLILIVSSLPGSALEKIQQLPDNVILRMIISDPAMHLSVFAVFSGSLCYGFYRSGISRIPLLKVILTGVVYVLFIEIYQAVIPWRSFGFDDILWGIIGTISAPILLRVTGKQ